MKSILVDLHLTVRSTAYIPSDPGIIKNKDATFTHSIGENPTLPQPYIQGSHLFLYHISQCISGNQTHALTVCATGT